jgi:hypothetical protein
LVFQALAGDWVGGALRTSTRDEQLLPGLDPLTLPPVDSTGPGVGVAVGVVGAAAGAGAAAGGRGV